MANTFEADNENRKRNDSGSGQLVGPKGRVLSGYEKPTRRSDDNPRSEDAGNADHKEVEPRGKTSKNNNPIH